ncbi:MAG: ribosomal L7Ae/L30e/S12e/Gadd45 family protein [Candidatus Nanoarchaeia archaeon]|nr:ribosomal L7Ae/L30e/S12e/Gadd45 family protein [Candidatus Paceibacterota bacterium]MDD5238866.1 ribosomal L7Ae/L30e/S12e/Gadd45 family protein [Candidatus Nanoarchaeia archaeon]
MADETSNIRKELEKSLEAKKVTYGTNSVTRALKQGLVSKLFYATNIPEKMKSELEYYAGLSGIQFVAFQGDSKDLGVALKRTHSVLIAAIVKG